MEDFHLTVLLTLRLAEQGLFLTGASPQTSSRRPLHRTSPRLHRGGLSHHVQRDARHADDETEHVYQRDVGRLEDHCQRQGDYLLHNAWTKRLYTAPVKMASTCNTKGEAGGVGHQEELSALHEKSYKPTHRYKADRLRRDAWLLNGNH